MNYDNLLEPQKEHTKLLVDSIYLNGFCVDMSMLGTGKTYVAASVAKNMNIPVVVICPKISIHNWNNVFNIFGIKPTIIINYEKLMRGNTPYMKYDKKAYINAPHWQSEKGMTIKFPKHALIILDEAHKCRGKNSHNSRFLVALKNSGYKFYLISATIASNPLDMRAFGYAVNLHSGYNFKSFIKNFGGIPDNYGGLKINMTDCKTQVAMKEIHCKLFNESKCAARMNTSQFGNIFPKNNVSAMTFDMEDNNTKIQQVYYDMETELAKLDDRIKEYSQHVFSIIMAARRKIELLKVPTMVELIEDYFDNNTSVIAFFNFTDTITAVINRLKDHKFDNMIGKIVGGQTSIQRQSDINDFNSDKKRIMIAAVKAGNASISLHDLNGKYQRNTIISPSFSSIDMEQCLGRAARAEGKTPVNQSFVYALNSIEEEIAYRINSKMKATGILNDGDLLPNVGIFK